MLRDAVNPTPGKLLNPERLAQCESPRGDAPVLVLLAAGKGTRFGHEPKCAQAVNGLPLARHSIEAFKTFSRSPVICIVGYRGDEVAAKLGDDNLYVRSEDPGGGTAFAAYEAFSVSELESDDPLVVVSMGDRIVPESVFKRLFEMHRAGIREADLTFLTALYEPPKHRGKGRIIRDAERRVMCIAEQRDIDAIADARLRRSLDDLTEANCPLYAIRARLFRRHLECLSNENSQGQYYLTDIIESLRREGGEIRTITTTVAEAEYDLLCCDVTRPDDLALLEQLLVARSDQSPPAPAIERAAGAIRADRPPAQVASLARQLEELIQAGLKEGFLNDRPVAVGIAGGRLRIAFMHPDMGRFFGPAWQMPIGAGDPSGREQIAMLLQCSDAPHIHLNPVDPEFREKVSDLPADSEWMYPTEQVTDWYSYEGFGSRMAENLLLSLGYFTPEELRKRKESGQPLPPSSLWISSSMRRPFPLIGNAIASIRTVRAESLRVKVEAALGRETFRGLRIVSSGNIPRGGFSSSSAVTVATMNAIDALFELEIPPDMLVQLSCQAEYGTGVRAGSLDQATIQKGRTGEGTLISSNPREHYRTLRAYPVPTGRYHVVFPYSVDRDREAWKWSAGTYAASSESDLPTTGETRKMTGKAAELAALLTRLPLGRDYFDYLEDDFLRSGALSPANRDWAGQVLAALPLLISRDELRRRVRKNRRWYIEQLVNAEQLDPEAAEKKTDATVASLFAGWRDPQFRRTNPDGRIVQEKGIPLRAMVAYLFGETAKNFQLIHHPDEWIEWVSRSQWGDRCFEIEPGRLPEATAMMGEMDWEKGVAGPALMERWLERFEARPFDFNRGLSDAELAPGQLPDPRFLEGTNFFRGLALIDLVEAMLKRAYGPQAVAVRINAAGQGDFFQVHIDTARTGVEEVKRFIRLAFYRRFGLSPEREFVETHPGGGAVGVRLERFDQMPDLVRAVGRGLPS